MSLLNGIAYNLRGLRLAIKTPKLLALGLLRFAVVILVTVLSAGLVLYYHQEVLNLLWGKPASAWLIWLWYVVSWLLSLLLVGLTTVLAYLITQILFAVLVMDWMSRITESMVAEKETADAAVPLLQQFFFLVRQEIPRAVLPILASLLLMVLSWATPLGPVITAVAAVAAAVFLAWDNTDLVPARRLYPFSQRFEFLRKNFLFHVGFGLLFLIPGLNIVFLSFAPVGATIYYIDRHDRNR
jgi:CysZ protein